LLTNKKLKLLELKNLYHLKFLGYDYTDNLKKFNLNQNISLPNKLKDLESLVGQCFLCDLSKSRKNPVFGRGNPNADIMFIGSAPNLADDSSGLIFSGRAGELLKNMIENVLKIKKDSVYVTNIVKCKTPNNRDIQSIEAHKCRNYLLKEIESVNPKIIVCLGEVSYHYITNDKQDIHKIRGKVSRFDNRYLIPIFHPNFLLRNSAKKRESVIDLNTIKGLM
jgi:DNA polymerase